MKEEGASPAEAGDRHELYFMCDNLNAEVALLASKGVQISAAQEARWGSIDGVAPVRGVAYVPALFGANPLPLSRAPSSSEDEW